MAVDPTLERAAPGTVIPRFEVDLSAEWNRRLLEAAASTWAAKGRVEPTVAGDLALAVYTRAVAGAMIHTVQLSRHHAVVPEGSTAVVAGKVLDRCAKRGRAYVEVSFDVMIGGVTAWDGVLTAMQPNTSLDGLPERDAPGSLSPAVQGRPGPPVDLGAGEREMACLSHTFSLDEMTLLYGPGNIHSDAERAAAVGLDQPVTQGLHVAALHARLLGERWGDRWLDDAEWEVRFVGMTWPGDTVTAVLLDPPGGDRVRDEVSLRSTKQDGTAVLVGRASLRG